MNNNILLFAERSIVTKKLRVVKFGIYIKENEHIDIINEMRNTLRENDEFALMLGILER